jgi:hypothetical protein
MDIQVATLCDAATDYGGKLNLLGTFDTIMAPQFPAMHPQCSIALRLAFSRIEEGSHRLSLNFVDEDGRSIMPSIELQAEVLFPAEGSFLSRNFIVNIQHLKFERPGQYAIAVAMDGRHQTSIPLQIRKIQAPEPPGTARR